MRHTAVFIACLLCVLVASSNAATTIRSGLLTYNGMVVQSNGDGNQVTLAPINACDKTQEWVLDSDGFIYQKSNSSLVLDDQNSLTRNGNPVIMWNKKIPYEPNQLWNLTATNVTTRVNGMCLRKSSSSNGVVISDNFPCHNFGFMDNPYTCPSTCTSHGDPHFVSWTGQRFDFQSPNTVLLANFSGNRIYSTQFACAPGVTCNEGFVIHPAGTNSTFQLTGTTKAYFNKVLTNVTMGTTSFGIFNVTKTSGSVFSVAFPGAVVSYGVYSWYYGNYGNIGVTLNAVASLGSSLCSGPASQNAHTFGSQFLVKNKNDTAYQYTVTPFNYDPNFVPNYGPFNTTDQDLAQRTTNACSMITKTPGLGACNALVDPTFFINSCYNDAYATRDVSFTQSNIDAYAALCSAAAKMNGTTIAFPTSGLTTMIVGAMKTLMPGVNTTFMIIAKDINSMNRTTGGDNFTITVVGPSSVTVSIRDNGDGTYTVTYMAGMEGMYTVSVKLNNVSDISESPFNVTVVATTSAMTSSVILGPYTAGMQYSVTIQARTSSGVNRIMGGDTFTVSFSAGNFTVVGVIDNMDGTYTITFIPNTTGTSKLDVMFQGTSIMCSPYTVIVK